MAVLYKPSKHAFFTEGPSLTEPEFRDSCDINIMMRNVHKGLNVRTAHIAGWANNPDGSPRYHDDLTIDALQHRINKQQIEDQLQELAQNEFEEKEFNLIPKSIRERFGFKLKKVQKNEPGQANDDQTTKAQPVQKNEPIQAQNPPSQQTPPKAPG